jgi:ketosteroid isomerase-like protein
MKIIPVRTFPAVALSSLLLTGCSGAGDSTDPQLLGAWQAELLEADVAFGEAVANQGAVGWVSFFAPDGSMISQGVGEIHGHVEIQGAMEEAFADPTYQLTWEPLRAEVSRSGDLGYTVGRYTSSRVGNLGQSIRSSGMYVTIWRRQADGSWKVEMDLGTPTSS